MKSWSSAQLLVAGASSAQLLVAGALSASWLSVWTFSSAGMRMLHCSGSKSRKKMEFDKALELYAHCRSLLVMGSPEDVDVLLQMSIVFSKMGQHENALKKLGECEDLLTQLKFKWYLYQDLSVDVLVEKARIYERQGMFDIALHFLEVALTSFKRYEAYPRYIDVLKRKAKVLKLQGLFDESLSVYQNCLSKQLVEFKKDHPDCINTVFRIAVLENSRGNRTATMSLLEECIRLAPKKSNCYKKCLQLVRELERTP